jgi:hypothetical protein
MDRSHSNAGSTSQSPIEDACVSDPKELLARSRADFEAAQPARTPLSSTSSDGSEDA